MKRRSSWILALLLSLTLSVVPAAEAFAFGRGAQGSDVYAVQGMLKSLGFFYGNITGYYGAQTQDAVKRFQKKYGLPATGTMDNETLKSLLWAYESAKIGKPAPAPAPAPAPTPAPAPNPPPSGVPELSADEQKMVDLVNEERRKAGLSPLAVDLELSRVARIKSQDMVDNNYFSHQSPTYGSPFDMMKSFGISFNSAGENIACNQTVEQAHQAFMNSSGHRANILSADFTHIGVGIVDGGPCGKMFTQQFVGR